MSSTFNILASSSELPTNDGSGSRIVHFDATLRRKEKMKRRATAQRSGPDSSPHAGEPAQPPAPINAAAVNVNNNGGARGALARSVAVAAPPAPPPEAKTVTSSQLSTATDTALSNEELERFLVNFVVEQTGYPEEMVELDADLEADLGIDSIKKAQLFGELAEHLNVQVEISEDMSLDDFPTLRHVLDFLQGAQTASPAVADSVAQPSAPAPPLEAETATSSPLSTAVGTALSNEELERFLVNFVVEQTGYPEEMVELDADLEADLGIDSIKKAQLFGELAEHLNVQVEISEDMSLDDFPTLRHVLDFLQGAQTASPAVADSVAQPSAPAPPLEAETATSSPLSTAVGTALSNEELERFLVNFVVEQTGYPEEMVELDADLEADLGIDSIKKAQLFGELAEHLNVQVEISEDMSLDDFPTLRHVLDFLQGAQTACSE